MINVTVDVRPMFRNVDDVHSLLDDIAEQQGVASEISEAISNPVGFSQDVDDVSTANLIEIF